VKASTETEICKFCHTPHNATPVQPLWNRNASSATYTLYTSSTLNASVGQPDGTSILCLSCHDGTIALGSIVNPSTTISFGSVTTMPAGKTNLGTNLSDDHPISFVYNSALAIADGQLKDTSAIVRPVSLDKNGKMQCTSCHDAHDNSYSKFLVATTQGSALCFSCHNRTYWSTSLHNTSTKTWNGIGTNPWLHTSYTTVADNACENCHKPHTAGGSQRIMNYLNEEDNCLNCHNGNVDTKNIAAQFSKMYRHNVYGYSGAHDPNEPASVITKHVECVDCHNPHAANSTTATAPNVRGPNIDVKGVNASGVAINTVSYEYEICFRCHADNQAFPRYTVRYRGVGNRRLDFATTNESYHPVEGPGKNTSMTSLISPLTTSSKIYCTDCHASDGSSPAGPHGSSNIAILKYAYDTARFPMLGVSWSATDLNNHWPLCFQCHNVSTVTTIHQAIHSGHFLKYTGCNTCHDPHGYDGSAAPAGGGGVTSAFTKLINFDTSVIRPNASNGKLIDIPGRKCFLVCHQNSTGTGGVYHVHRTTGSSF
jgi:predicted CXXCH cytochrome family protein